MNIPFVPAQSGRERKGCNIYFHEADLLVLHIPRTGGIWRRNAVKFSCKTIGPWHANLAMIREDGKYPFRNVALFMRPVDSWYESIWDLLMHGNRALHGMLEFFRLTGMQDCMDDDIDKFAQNITQKCPGFYYRYAMDMLAGGYDNLYLGRTNTNLEDFERIMHANNIEPPERMYHLAIPQSRKDRDRMRPQFGEQLLAGELAAHEECKELLKPWLSSENNTDG